MKGAAAVSQDVFAANRAFGRIAFTVEAGAGATRYSRLREEGSLRVRFPGPPSPELEAVIVNTAGGIAGGDRFELDVTVAPGARLVVTTAAAEKIYRSLGPDASIKVKLAVGGSLAWIPQETILFDGGRLARAIDVDLAGDARVILAESIIFGRSGMNETVQHGRLIDQWRLHRNGRVIHAEAMRFDGALASKLAQPAVAKGAVAVGTVLLWPGDEETAVGVRALGDRFLGEVGVSAWNGLVVIRLCAADGAALRHDLVATLNLVRGASLPRLWLN